MSNSQQKVLNYEGLKYFYNGLTEQFAPAEVEAKVNANTQKLTDIADGAEVNQNAFSNIKVGTTTIAADTKTDTLTLVAGSNITLTTDTGSDQITISATDTNTNYYHTPAYNTGLSIATGSGVADMFVPTAGSTPGVVSTTSTVTSTTGLTACPIISGVPYYKDTNTTYGVAKYNTLGLVKPAYSSTGAAILTTAAATNTTTPTIAAKTTTSGRYYGVETDKNGVLFVNVPWSNTTYSVMGAATSSAAGTSGLVPAPAAGKQNSFLRGDGTWVVPTDTKVTQTSSEPTTATSWYLLGGVNSATATAGSYKNSDFRVKVLQGTASAEGYVSLIIGNSTASGTAGNKKGQISLYSDGTNCHYIEGMSDDLLPNDNYTHWLPATSGILLNSSNFGTYAVSKTGDTMTGRLEMKPLGTGAEGGEILLGAQQSATTYAGIVLDNYNSTFRIFGQASSDGTTITGTGTPLVINPYAKTITGGYTITGTLSGNASSASRLVILSCNNKDFNEITAHGVYQGYTGMTNAAFNNISVLEVLPYSTDWILQRQTLIGSDGVPITKERIRYGGRAWSEWKIPESSLTSLGTLAPELNRVSDRGNLYTYNTNATVDTTAMPTIYTSVIGFGRNTLGHTEIASGWTSTRGLWYRNLRDTTDNWFDWIKVIDSNGGTITGGNLTIDLGTNAPKYALARTVSSVVHNSLYEILSNGNVAVSYYDSDWVTQNRMTLTATSTTFMQPVTIPSGGTGATTPSAALTNLGGVGYTVIEDISSLL